MFISVNSTVPMYNMSQYSYPISQPPSEAQQKLEQAFSPPPQQSYVMDPNNQFQQQYQYNQQPPPMSANTTYSTYPQVW